MSVSVPSQAEFDVLAAAVASQSASLATQASLIADLTLRVSALETPLPPPPPPGNFWSDPATWGGSVPTISDEVTIPAGKTVTLDGNVTFRTLTIEDGGALVGTAASEIVIGDAPLPTPDYIGHGIVCRGKLHLAGATKTPFSRLAVAPLAGETTLELSSAPSGWNVGDRLFIPDSRQVNDPPAGFQWQFETAIIASIAGATVTLTAPLAYNHPAASEDATMLPHVGNLTRNIVIRSANPLGVRGHIHATMDADVDLRYVEGRDLGRTTLSPVDPVTNPIGRYPIHLHMLTGPIRESGYRFVVQGCAVHGTLPQPVSHIWPITVHGTDDGLVADNVCFNHAGAGVMVEQHGMGNQIERNFVCGVRGNGASRADNGMGREGVAFWGQQATGNHYCENVAANFAMHGFVFFQGGGFADFCDNEAYGGRNGLTMWEINGAGTGGPNTSAPITFIDRFKAWHCWEHGVGLGYPAYNVHFVDLVVLGQNHSSGRGFYFGDYQTLGLRLVRPVIKGMRFGVWVPYIQQPGDAFLIDSPTFANSEVDVVVDTPGIPGGGGWPIGPRGTLIVNPTWPAYAAGSERWNLNLWHHVQSGSNLNMVDMVRVHYASGERIRVYYNEQTTIAIGGELAPAGATTRPGINGLVEVE